MSLVNDTLRGLEERRAEQPGSLYTAASVTVGRDGLSAAARKCVTAGVAMMAVAVAIYLGRWAGVAPQLEVASDTGSQVSAGTFVSSAETKNVPPATILVEETIPSNEPDLISLAQVRQSEVAVVSASETEAERQADRDAVNAETGRLLELAAEALQRDRLSSPENDNALHYYRQVLLIDAGSREAQLGIQAIVSRYTELAEQAYREGRTANALLMASKAAALQPDYAPLTALRERLMAEQTPVTVEAVQHAVSNNSPDEQLQALSSEKIVENGLTAEAGEVFVQPSEETLDQQRAARARALADDGQYTDAIAMLDQAFTQGVLGEAGLSLLAELYLEQGDTARALGLLQTQPLAADRAAYLVGRAQLQQGNLAAALATLEAQQPAISGFPEYYGLLAGLYQKGGRSSEAYALYRKLVAIQPDTYTHWLGLAVVMDKLGENSLPVFQRVLQMLPEQQDGSPQQASQQKSVKQYVERRIAALTAES